MTLCCPYHDDPTLMDNVVYLPTRIMFHSPGGKRLNAILYNRMGRVLICGHRMTTTWSAACHIAFQMCNEKMPTLCHHNVYWSINVQGEDVFMSKIKEHKYVNSGMDIKMTDHLFCTSCQNDTSTKVTYKKVRMKMQPAEKHKAVQSSPKEIVLGSKKGKRNTENSKSPRKLSKDESLVIDDDEEEDDFSWTPNDNVWTTDVVEQYVVRNPNDYPTLLRITMSYKAIATPKNCCNFIYECVFEHPLTKKEVTVDIGSSVLYLIPAYKSKMQTYASCNI